jgi:hypothetical protein
MLPLIIIEIPTRCDQVSADAVSRLLARCWKQEIRWFILDLRLRTELCQLIGPVINDLDQHCQSAGGGIALLSTLQTEALVFAAPVVQRSGSISAAIELIERLAGQPVRLAARFAEADVMAIAADAPKLNQRLDQIAL